MYLYYEPAIEVPASSQLKVELYDYDEDDSDDLIKTLNYEFSGNTSYPTTLMSWEGNLKVEMEIEWVY